MLKYLLLALYFVITIYLYKTFLHMLDGVKDSYDEKYKDDPKVTKSTYCALCDFIYILFMVFWPICILLIIIRTKKGKGYVHKSENQGRDGEGPHQD